MIRQLLTLCLHNHAKYWGTTDTGENVRILNLSQENVVFKITKA